MRPYLNGKLLEQRIIRAFLNMTDVTLDSTNIKRYNAINSLIKSKPLECQREIPDFDHCGLLSANYFSKRNLLDGNIHLNKDWMGKYGIVSDFDISDTQRNVASISVKNNNMIIKHNSPRAITDHIGSLPAESVSEYKCKYDYIVNHSSKHCQNQLLAQHFSQFVESQIAPDPRRVKDLFYFQTGIQASHIICNHPSHVYFYERYLFLNDIETVKPINILGSKVLLQFNDVHYLHLKISGYKYKKFSTNFSSIEDFYSMTSVSK